MKHTKNRPLLMTLAVMLLWGSLYPAVKLGFSAYGIASTGDILLFAGIRFAISGAAVCLWQFFRNRPALRTTKTALGPVLMSGLFAIVLHYSFNYLGLNLTDSSKTALMKQIAPLLYVCLSFLFFREDRLTIRKLIAALVGFAGIIALNLDGGRFHFQAGDALILAASFCTVASNVVSKKALKQVEPVSMTGVSQLSGGGVLLLLGLAMGGRLHISWQSAPILLFICLATIISYCLWYSVVREGELSRLFIIKFAEPVFACLIGACLLGENIMKAQYLAAFLLISLGVCISQK